MLNRREFIRLTALAVAGVITGCGEMPKPSSGLPEGLSFADGDAPDKTLAPDTILLQVSVAPDSVIPFARAAQKKVTAAHGLWLGVEDTRHFLRTLTSESARQAADGTITFTLAVSAASNEAHTLGAKHPDQAFSTARKAAIQKRSNALVEATQAIATSFGDKSGEHQIALKSLGAYAIGKTLNEGEIQAVGILLSADHREARRVIRFVDPKNFTVWLQNMPNPEKNKIAKLHLATFKDDTAYQSPYLTLMELFADTHVNGLTMPQRAEIIRKLLDDDQTKLRAAKLVCSLEDKQRRALFELLSDQTIAKITSSLYQPISNKEANRQALNIIKNKIKNDADKILLNQALKVEPNNPAVQPARAAISGRLSQQFTPDERNILAFALNPDKVIAADIDGLERKLVAQQWAVDLLDYAASSNQTDQKTSRTQKIQRALVIAMKANLVDLNGNDAQQRLYLAQLFWRSVFSGASGLVPAERDKITTAARNLLYDAIASVRRGNDAEENMRLAIGLYNYGSPPVKPREEADLFLGDNLHDVNVFLENFNKAASTPQMAAEVLRHWFAVQEETAPTNQPVPAFDKFLEHYDRWAGTANDHRRVNDLFAGRENIFGGLALFLTDSTPIVRASVMTIILQKYPHLAGALAHAGLSREAILEILPMLTEQHKKKWLSELLLSAGLYYEIKQNTSFSQDDDRLLRAYNPLVKLSPSYATSIVRDMDAKQVDRALSRFGGWQSVVGDILPVPAVARRGKKPKAEEKRSLGYLLAEILPDAIAKRQKNLPYLFGMGEDKFYLQIAQNDEKVSNSETFSIWSILQQNFPLGRAGYPFEIHGVGKDGEILIIMAQKDYSVDFVNKYIDGSKLTLAKGRNSGDMLLKAIKEHIAKEGKFALVADVYSAAGWLNADSELQTNPPFELMLVKSLKESKLLYVSGGVEHTIVAVAYQPKTKQYIATIKAKSTSSVRTVALSELFRNWQIK